MFSVVGEVDTQTAYEFSAGPGDVEIRIGQLMRSVTQEPFQLQVSGRKVQTERAADVEEVVEDEVNGACDGGGTVAPRGRSNACGAQLCQFNVYLNRDGKPKREEEKLGIGVTLSESVPPVISWEGMGGAQSSKCALR